MGSISVQSKEHGIEPWRAGIILGRQPSVGRGGHGVLSRGNGLSLIREPVTWEADWAIVGPR